MRSVGVLAGSKLGTDPRFERAAKSLGRSIAERGMRLVYGGARVGLMGAVADAARAKGGEVVGVMPRSLVDNELAHRDLTKLHVVETLAERKELMAELSEGFVALPGG